MSIAFPPQCYARPHQRRHYNEQTDGHPANTGTSLIELGTLPTLNHPSGDRFISVTQTPEPIQAVSTSKTKKASKLEQEKFWKLLEIISHYPHSTGKSPFFAQLLQSVHSGIDINALNDENTTPLLWAASHGFTTVVQDLLGVPGIDVNKTNNSDKDTALLLAVKSGKIGIVRLLLAHPDIKVNQANRRGNTPLQEAAAQGSEETASLLLGQSDINRSHGIERAPKSPSPRAPSRGSTFKEERGHNLGQMLPAADGRSSNLSAFPSSFLVVGPQSPDSGLRAVNGSANGNRVCPPGD